MSAGAPPARDFADVRPESPWLQAGRPPIRLLGLDLDGTVFNSEKRITPATLAAIRRAIAAGCQVLPVTGRILAGLPAQFTAVPGVAWAVTANGAAIVRLADGQVVHAVYLDRAAALDAAALCLSCDAMVDVYTGGLAVTQADRFARLEEFSSPEMVPYFRASRTVTADLPAYVRAGGAGIEKVTALFTSEQQRQEAMARLEADGRYLVTSSLPNNLEVNARGIDKGKGLLLLAKMLGIPPAQTMAIGDSSNDLPMLQAAGLSVAMGNATAQAKAAAHALTADNDHDGVALAIERYVLEPPGRP